MSTFARHALLWRLAACYRPPPRHVARAAIRGRSLFVYAEAALLYQTACQRHKVELGLNYPLSAKLSLLTQIWSERGAPYSLSDKIQTELIWHRPLLDLSLGYRAEHSGAFDEQALVFAMASRF